MFNCTYSTSYKRTRKIGQEGCVGGLVRTGMGMEDCSRLFNSWESGICISCIARTSAHGYRSVTFHKHDYPAHRLWSRVPQKIRRLFSNMAVVIEDFTITEDQIRIAKDVFKKYDKRCQDKISTTDLGPAFSALNLNVRDDTLKEWADLVDEEATGFIDQEGFLILYGKKLKDDADEKDLRDAFRILDKNRRGEIDVEDLRWILKSLGDDLSEEEIEEMIRDTDTDGSGFVDFDEFYKLMTG